MPVALVVIRAEAEAQSVVNTRLNAIAVRIGTKRGGSLRWSEYNAIQ